METNLYICPVIQGHNYKGMLWVFLYPLHTHTFLSTPSFVPLLNIRLQALEILYILIKIPPLNCKKRIVDKNFKSSQAKLT